MKTARVIAFVVVAVLTAGLLSMGASAKTHGEVKMGSHLWLRVRNDLGGYTAKERADIIQKRVNQVLSLNEINLNEVEARKVGNEAAIYVNGAVLITVGQEAAKSNNSTPLGLAKVWAERFKEIYPKAIPKKPTNRSFG